MQKKKKRYHLSDPGVHQTATLEGLALGTDEVPGPWTMAGAVINIAASALIAADAQNQSKTVQLKELEVN